MAQATAPILDSTIALVRCDAPNLEWLSTAADANISLALNQWHHYLYAVTPNAYTIYMDGVQVGSGSFSGTPLLYNSSTRFRIGESAQGEFFPGMIDDVRIYNRALSASEVKQLYNAGR